MAHCVKQDADSLDFTSFFSVKAEPSEAAMAAAGLVQFAAGEVQVRRGDVFSALARGAAVDGGDVILTGSTGRAQIRFTDGGLVSLSDRRLRLAAGRKAA